jgi:hypothetical protein
MHTVKNAPEKRLPPGKGFPQARENPTRINYSIKAKTGREKSCRLKQAGGVSGKVRFRDSFRGAEGGELLTNSKPGVGKAQRPPIG